MPRIHFTCKDLAGLSVAEDFDPMWELVLGLHRPRGREVDVDLVPHSLTSVGELLLRG